VPEPALIAISESQSCAATVLIDEFDTGGLEGGPDRKQRAGMGGAALRDVTAS